MPASKVLVVDDDQDFAASLAEYLQLDGHEVDVAYSGNNGLQAVVAESYDYIIIDIGLPDGNGVDSMYAMRKSNPGARMVLITGYSANQLDQMVTVPGDVEVLTKPLDLEALSQRLSDAAGAQPN